MADVPDRLDPVTAPFDRQPADVEHMHREPRRRLRPNRPRRGPSAMDDGAVVVAHDEVDRIRAGPYERRPHGTAAQVPHLIDPDLRPAGQRLVHRSG
jgi:hypothetical protein